MLNEPTLVHLSAEARALVRAAIRANPGWRAYAEANDCDLSTMTTKEAICACCDALAIDIAAVIAAGPQDEPPKADRPKRVPLKNELPLDAPKASPAPAIAPTGRAPTEAAQALVDLFAGLQKSAPLDHAAVEQIVDARLDQHRDVVTANVSAIIDAALAGREQIVRIEIRRGEEIKPVDGHHHPQFAKLLRAMSARQADGRAPNIWISGPAGSGKTHAVKIAAQSLAAPYHYNGALSMPHELLGFIDAAGKYHRTPFREAYEHGGVYLFDEVDGSDNSALLALNAALANGTATFPDGQVQRHADTWIVATANTWGLGATADYVGRSKIDAAFLSRFPVRLAWDYDEVLEQAMCGNADFAKRVQRARGKARAAGLKVLIDPRASIAGAALIAAGMSEQEAAEATYLANLTADQRRQVEG